MRELMQLLYIFTIKNDKNGRERENKKKLYISLQSCKQMSKLEGKYPTWLEKGLLEVMYYFTKCQW